ncbi:LmeA family phospholipid-binding protein [Micromonospora sp. CPCC 205561]|uniref:LmeA family phospholipid-binding protein n=1 Tax=Micromonospora sp. CPCC 205561 TaxID=3122407 RepID=UPI002FEF0399
MAQDDAYEERPRRRGRKVLVTLLVLLLVLGGLIVVADRVAVGVAERAIADQVRQEIAKQGAQSSEPQVKVGGVPFLTQVLDGRYERISIALRDVQGPVQGDVVALPKLDVDARNVRASLDTLRSGRGDVVAETVNGTGTISYDSLAKLLDRPGLALAEQGGRLAVTAPVDILGQRLTVTGTADITVGKEGQVSLRFDDLNAAGLPNLPLARMLLNNYARSISIDVPLPELPFQLAVREVRPLPEGLAVTADARNVPINSAAG